MCTIGPSLRSHLGNVGSYAIPRQEGDTMRTKSEISDTLAVIALACGILLGLPTAAQAADYKIDTAHSFSQYRVSHLGSAWVFCRFNT